MPEPDLITPELLRDWALPDPAGAKQARGRVLIIGGAAGSPGGVALAGLAALRVGAGKVQLALASSVAPAVAAAFPEAGVIALVETDSGSIRGSAASESCAEAVRTADAVLVGPGLDDADEADALLRDLLPAIDGETALALDAYALGVLPGLADLASGPRGRSLAPVLTPNAEELGRLLEREVDPDGSPWWRLRNATTRASRHRRRSPTATDGAGGFRRVTPVWRRPAAVTCSPGSWSGCWRGAPRPRRPLAGAPTCTPWPASGSPRRSVGSASSPASSSIRCRRCWPSSADDCPRDVSSARQKLLETARVPHGATVAVVVEVGVDLSSSGLPLPDPVGPPVQVAVRVGPAVQRIGVRSVEAYVDECPPRSPARCSSVP